MHPLPGIAPSFQLNTAITPPVGVEAYGAYALGAWLSGPGGRARDFARRSAIGSLLVGMLGQVAYHLLTADHATRAPWPVVVLVACLPVVTLGFGAALAHLLWAAENEAAPMAQTEDKPADLTELTAAGRPPVTVYLSATFAAAKATEAVRFSQACSSKWLSHPDDHAILRDIPGISGAEMGRKLGVSTRQGQRILATTQEA